MNTPTPRTDYLLSDYVTVDQLIDHAREIETELTAVTEQRDRLEEALRKAKPIVSRYPSGWDFSHDELDAADEEIDEALKSLTTNNQNDE
jgi:histidinol-phosphate/aromatic aminotransferase/cobyric acid decarboxylase-like protein